MERSLLLGALALNIVSWCCGLAAARAKGGTAAGFRALPMTLWGAAIAFPTLFWLLTLPDAPPFGVGHAAGNGVLLGGIAAVMGAVSLLSCVKTGSVESRAAGTAMLLALASATAIVTLSLFKQNRLDALMGVGMGWTAASCILYIGALQSGSAAANLATILAKGTGFIVAVCAALGIGALRDSMMPGSRGGTWSTLVAVLAATVPFVVLLSALPAGLAAKKMPLPNLFGAEDEEQSVAATRGWQLVLASVLFLLVAQVLAIKIADKPSLMFCAALGVAAGAISWRVVADSARKNVTPVLAPLVLLAAFIVSYRLMQGFGGGIMLLGTWIAGALEENLEVGSQKSEVDDLSSLTPSSSLLPLLFFGAVAMLYRLAATRFRYEIDTLELDEHFAFFGLLVGAALPIFLARLMAARAALSPANMLLRLVLCGAILVAAPLVCVMLWGAKAALVLTAGAGLGLLIAPAELALPHAAGFFALAGTLVVAEWTKRALPLYEIARDDKTKLLGLITVVLVVLMLAVDIVSRRRRPK